MAGGLVVYLQRFAVVALADGERIGLGAQTQGAMKRIMSHLRPNTAADAQTETRSPTRRANNGRPAPLAHSAKSLASASVRVAAWVSRKIRRADSSDRASNCGNHAEIFSPGDENTKKRRNECCSSLPCFSVSGEAKVSFLYFTSTAKCTSATLSSAKLPLKMSWCKPGCMPAALKLPNSSMATVATD